jgi:hypothetical protein
MLAIKLQQLRSEVLAIHRSRTKSPRNKEWMLVIHFRNFHQVVTHMRVKAEHVLYNFASQCPYPKTGDGIDLGHPESKILRFECCQLMLLDHEKILEFLNNLVAQLPVTKRLGRNRSNVVENGMVVDGGAVVHEIILSNQPRVLNQLFLGLRQFEFLSNVEEFRLGDLASLVSFGHKPDAGTHDPVCSLVLPVFFLRSIPNIASNNPAPTIIPLKVFSTELHGIIDVKKVPHRSLGCGTSVTVTRIEYDV